MTTSERIAAAIKPILDEDRRADRVRIADLERDLAALRCARENADSALEEHNIAQAKLIITLNKQLDELNEKCAALVVENKRLSEYASGNWVDVPPPSDAGCTYPECGPTCRRDCPPAPAVETPAVEVKEQGPWVVYDDPDNLQINPCMGRHGWGKVSEGIGPFDARSDAVAALNGWVMGGYSKAPRVITLAEARAIEAKR